MPSKLKVVLCIHIVVIVLALVLARYNSNVNFWIQEKLSYAQYKIFDIMLYHFFKFHVKDIFTGDKKTLMRIFPDHSEKEIDDVLNSEGYKKICEQMKNM